MINWDWKYLYKDVVEFHKDLIKLRKLHPALRMGSADNVRNNLRFLNVNEPNLVAFSLNGAAVNDSWKDVIVIYNGNNKPITYEVPNKPWKVYLDENRVWLDGNPLLTKGKVIVPAISAVIIGVTE
jgi:pullulanase